MSANGELVQGAFEAFASRGLEAALPYFASDCVWHPTDRWLDEAAYRGHDGMRRLVGAWLENFDSFGYQVHEIRDAGDRVVVRLDMIGRIKNSGQSVSQPLGFVVSRFHEGTFGDVRVLASWPEALAAAGLEG
jgi:ketosteroid isomerase-like protein